MRAKAQPELPPVASQDRERKPTPSRLGSLLAAYLLVRVVLANAWPLLAPASVARQGNDVIEASMYILIALMVVSRRHELALFHIDRPAVLIFLVFGTLLRTSPESDAVRVLVSYAPFLFAASWLLYSLWRGGAIWPLPSWGLAKSVLAGVLVGVCLGAVSAAPTLIAHWEGAIRPGAAAITGMAIGGSLVHFMGHSAILEEPVFRGFLWGYLKNRAIGERWILLVQAGLFLISHARFIGRSTTFWITVPLGALAFGWLAWKSRSVTPSLIAHTVYNSMGLIQ